MVVNLHSKNHVGTRIYLYLTNVYITDPERLKTFILSVGNSSDRARYTGCASNYDRVAAGATVTKTCIAVARYLSFRRDGGDDSYVTGLCEVVVIGHTHVCK